MPLKVFNSLTRKKEDFKPIEQGRVRMYVCGPTVYALSHIGHARSAVAFDVVYRYLSYTGFDVAYARNYTDVDDKIIQRANSEGVSSKEIAERYIAEFDRDMESLGVLLPRFRPKATETIGEIIDVTKRLIDNGYAYAVDGDVYYSVRKFNGYGSLSGKNIDELSAGARVEVGEKKADPLDFALWKASKPGEPSWESPWGPGRPGWHIECSAMCMKHLGETIDIHGGGKDLIFPHHENEIAQSEAATKKGPYARYWLHNGFVNIEKEKMSKSLGNILNIRDALEGHTPEAIRLFLLSSHYRSPIDYTAESLKDTEAAVERFYRTLERMERDFQKAVSAEVDKDALKERIKPIFEAMDDDFNTAAVVGLIFKEANEANRAMDQSSQALSAEAAKELCLIYNVFKEAPKFLGTLGKKPSEYFAQIKGRSSVPVEEIERLIGERNEARAKKDFKRADEIRKELLAKNIALEDTPRGTEWSIKG